MFGFSCRFPWPNSKEVEDTNYYQRRGLRPVLESEDGWVGLVVFHRFLGENAHFNDLKKKQQTSSHFFFFFFSRDIGNGPNTRKKR